MKWSGIGGGSSDDDSVFHGIKISEGLDNVGNGGSLLSNSDVDAEKLLNVIIIIMTLLLVNNGINSDSGLTGLSITNDELSLSSTNWYKGIDGFESGLHWLVDGFSWDNTWGLELNSLSGIGFDWSFTIDWVTEGINDSTKHTISNWDIDNGATINHSASAWRRLLSVSLS